MLSIVDGQIVELSSNPRYNVQHHGKFEIRESHLVTKSWNDTRQYSRKCIKWLQIAFCIGCMLPFKSAVAATPLPFPSPNLFDAGQFERNLRATEVIQPTSSAPEVKKQLPPVKPVPQGQQITFKLTKVIITGNTIYSSRQLACLFAPHMNKTISLADLEADVQKVSDKYRDAGYVLTRAILPAQEIENGVVRVQVVEGYISKVVVSGDPWSSKQLLEQHGAVVMCSRPLQAKVLEREILLSNDIPGMSVQAVITPSKNIPGSADLNLVATRKRVSGYASYDNFSTRYLGPLETSLGANYNSVWPNDTNAIHLVAASTMDEMYFYELVHTQILDVNGLNFTIGANYTQTKPGFTLDIFHIVGRSFAGYSSLVYPVIRSRTNNLFLRAAANYQNVSSLLLGEPNYNDLIRTVSFGGYYNGPDPLKGANSLELGLTQGLPIWGAVQHVNQSRPDGRVTFTKANLNVVRTQPLYKRLSLLTAAQGQYTRNSLLATEQYSYGGPLFGRGYDLGEIVGDKGYGAKVELHLLTQPEWKILNTIDFFVFYDAGEIWNYDDLNQPGQQSATSTGVGANFTFMPQLTGQFFVGKPLSRKVAVLTQMDQNPNQGRMYFQVVATF